jgi:hypothetical protein
MSIGGCEKQQPMDWEYPLSFGTGGVVYGSWTWVGGGVMLIERSGRD